MTKTRALELIQLYIDGWKENDVSKIIKSLAPYCEIIESHGPIYRGAHKIKKWVGVWLRSEGKVNRWDITSFYFTDDTTIFEWIFDCNVNNKNYYIEGISIVRFTDDKINYLREYRTTKSPFDWNEKELSD